MANTLIERLQYAAEWPPDEESRSLFREAAAALAQRDAARRPLSAPTDQQRELAAEYADELSNCTLTPQDILRAYNTIFAAAPPARDALVDRLRAMATFAEKWCAQCGECPDLFREAAAALAQRDGIPRSEDARRLDWLERNAGVYVWRGTEREYLTNARGLRESIDAAEAYEETHHTEKHTAQPTENACDLKTRELTDDELMAILNEHAPSQGEPFEWIPFARDVIRATTGIARWLPSNETLRKQIENDPDDDPSAGDFECTR